MIMGNFNYTFNIPDKGILLPDELHFTMKGNIKFQDLKELCSLFFDQRTKFEEEHNL